MADEELTYPVVLDLAGPTRTGYRVAGAFFIVIGVFLLAVFAVVGLGKTATAYEGIAAGVIGLALIAYGIVLLVRGPRMSVTLTATDATVRGMFSTRAIPRSAIAQVTSFPTIVWTGADGRTQRTPVNALNLNSRARTDPAIRTRVDGMTARLKAWSKNR